MGRRKKLCNDTDIPQDQIERIARCLLPDMRSFFESEEGQKEFAAWKQQDLLEGVGLSQNKLGKLVGLPQSSINRYEQGQSTPSTKTFRWYADYFDVSLDYIFGRTDDSYGVNYDYKPKINPEMEKFVEMCFEPGSDLNCSAAPKDSDTFSGVAVFFYCNPTGEVILKKIF